MAVAILTVGIKEFSGAGRVGEGPKVCSAATLSGSLQAASGSASVPIHIASRILLRMFAPRILAVQYGKPDDVHSVRHEIHVK
jgi:hypothetical protein